MKIDYAKIEEQLEILLALDKIYSWRELTKGQYRINESFDIYPRHQRYFVIKTEERGEYDNLQDFITEMTWT